MNNFTTNYLKILRTITTNTTLSKEQITSITEPLDLNGQADSLTAALKNKKEFTKDDEVFLTLQKILWNETDIKDVSWKDNLLEVIFIYYLSNKLPLIHVLSLLSKLRAYNIFNEDFIPYFSYLNLNKDVKTLSFEDWLATVKQDSENLGSNFPSLEKCIEVYQELFTEEVPEHWDQISTIISSIEERREFTDEILNSCSEEDLEDIMHWIKWSKRKDITRKIINMRLKKVKDFSNVEKLEKTLNANSLGDLPLSYNILDESIQKLPMTAVTDKTFENVPQQFISSWAPKFVYSVSEPETDPQIKIYFPGGKHIGHSGIVIKTKKGAVLLDFGMSVVNNSLAKWMPILDYVDAVLLSHAHGDHSGGLPLLMKKNPNLPIITKSETKKLLNALLHNNASILSRNYPKGVIRKDPILKHLVNRTNVNTVLDNIYEIKPRESITLFPDFDVKTWDASHLFGSVGFEINIAGKRLLYTGDFNADGTSIFPGAKFPTDVDAFIFDGTYYGREPSNQTFPNLKTVLKNSKRVLIPAFSLGRSQEILHQLKKMQAHKRWKIIMTGMGGKIATDLNRATGMGPVTDTTGLEIVPRLEKEEDFVEGTIVIAGQGMLQNGTSRNLLDYSASDEETGVVFCGYQAPYSLGADIQNKNPYLMSKYKQNFYKIKMSGHTSPETLTSILDKTSGKKIVVHAPTDKENLLYKEDILIPHAIKPFTV